MPCARGTVSVEPTGHSLTPVEAPVKAQSQNQPKNRKPFLARAAMPLAIAITLASAEAIVWQAAAAQNAPQSEQVQTMQRSNLMHAQQKAPSFATLDTNGDGIISRQEAEAFAPLASDFDRLVSEEHRNDMSHMSQGKNSVNAQREGITRTEYLKWKSTYSPTSEQTQPANPVDTPHPDSAGG